MTNQTVRSAPLHNSHTNPRAMFASRQEAHDAACALNDRFNGYYASYQRIDDRCWRVEAKHITLPAFLKALAAAGCDGWV